MNIDLSIEDLEKHSKELLALRGCEIHHMDLIEAYIASSEDDFFPSGAQGFGERARRGEQRIRLANELKQQMYLLVCTNDKKYEKVRSAIGVEKNRSASAVISLISAAIGSQLGLSAAIIMPIAVICLHGFVSIGKNTFCSILSKTCQT